MTGPELRTTLDKPEVDPAGDEVVCEVNIDFSGSQRRELPLHVVFCIDVSGSMSGEPLKNAKRGAKKALDKLHGNDHFSVVAFASRADTAIEPTKANRRGLSDGKEVLERIKDTDTGGGTTIMKGVDRSLKQFRRMPDEEAVRWIVFLTDGSDYSFDPAKASRKIDNADVTAHTAGFGNYDEEQLRPLAHRTNGTWKHIGNPSEMPRWFQQRIQNARGVVATDPVLRIDSRDGTLERAFYTVGEEDEPRDIPTTTHESSIDANLGDLNADDPPAIYLRFDTPEMPLDESPLTLADLTLETRAGNAHTQVEVELTDPVMQIPENRNPTVRRNAEVGEAIMTAVNDDEPEKALRKLEAFEEETEMKGDEKVGEVKGKVKKLSDSSGDAAKEAKDEVSGLMRTTDDG